ncbi:hypothetical protein [Truepera radiovictrix]|uniref:hypothetical protein n=1 Tax=Truepera radiovictrix TaxID=332249 RepID=UPI0011D0A557|nr:hypothetical protein [Truepera radiovictrix]WMT58185.1 hypothetical protein RCV51_04350 [Truepera radiovictrix]
MGTSLRRGFRVGVAGYALAFLVTALLLAPLIADSCSFGLHPHSDAQAHHLCATVSVASAEATVDAPKPQLSRVGVRPRGGVQYLERRTPPRANGSRAPPVA